MIELIPAIDIIEGQCVRLTKGDYDQKTVYRDSPAEVAKEFEEIGFKRLHVVDLDGAKSKHIVNSEVLRRITTDTQLVVDFGGGIKTDEDIEKAFAAGASMVTIGSIAVTNPDLFMGWLEKYGAERIILGADVRHGKVSINGWKEDSSEDLLPFLKKYVDAGVKNVLCTEISKDGTLTGKDNTIASFYGVCFDCLFCLDLLKLGNRVNFICRFLYVCFADLDLTGVGIFRHHAKEQAVVNVADGTCHHLCLACRHGSKEDCQQDSGNSYGVTDPREFDTNHIFFILILHFYSLGISLQMVHADNLSSFLLSFVLNSDSRRCRSHLKGCHLKGTQAVKIRSQDASLAGSKYIITVFIELQCTDTVKFIDALCLQMHLQLIHLVFYP